MQHLLGRAKGDVEQVRDDVRDYVVEHLHADQAEVEQFLSIISCTMNNWCTTRRRTTLRTASLRRLTVWQAIKLHTALGE